MDATNPALGAYAGRSEPVVDPAYERGAVVSFCRRAGFGQRQSGDRRRTRLTVLESSFLFIFVGQAGDMVRNKGASIALAFPLLQRHSVWAGPWFACVEH